MMYFILVILGVVLFFGAIILPWRNKSKLSVLREDIDRIQDMLQKLVPMSEEEKAKSIAMRIYSDKSGDKVSEVPEVLETDKAEGKIEDIPQIQKKPKKEIKKKATMEQQFGAKLPVWLGGIALALSGVFLVKYSIDNNLMTPQMRVIAGVLSGVLCLIAGNFIRLRPNFANGVRISQSLSGAGIAVLYAVLFAATSLYHLIPSSLGFVAMAGVTGLAIFLSLLYGPPIALLGLLGGFLTPMLIGSADPSAPMLFGYLYFVFAGLMVVIRRENWWKISIVAIIGSFLWVLFWLDGGWSAGDGLWIGLFLLAVTATIILATWKTVGSDTTSKTVVRINYLAFAGCLFMMMILLDMADFGMIEWGLFALLSAGSIVLSWLKPEIYSKATYLSLMTSFALIFMNWGMNDIVLLKILSVFGALYIVGGYALMWRTENKDLWSKITCFAMLGYYLIAYASLYLDSLTPVFFMDKNTWGILALILSMVSGFTLLALRKHDGKVSEVVGASFALTATAFLSLALTIVLDSSWWGLAIAMEACAVSWISTRVSIPKLKTLAMWLFIISLLMLSYQLLIVISVMISSLTAHSQNVGKLMNNLPEWPLFQILVTGGFFVATGHFLRQKYAGKIVNIMEWSGLMVVAIGAYYLLRQAFHPEGNFLSEQAGLFERGIVTNMLFAFALICLTSRRLLSRESYGTAGITFLVLAVLRVYYFDLFLLNPIFEHQNVGKVVVLNSLWLSYAFPIAWAYFSRREVVQMKVPEFLQLNKTMLILLVAFVSLQVRQFYHGEYLDIGITTDMEIYTYSIVWLLTGIGMLTVGIIGKNKLIRYASLGILTLTVAKVFLYDASALEGLYRVFSFFGLGVSLICISYVYTRFVLEKEEVE